MIKVGIIGGAGYTAGEMLRILLNHPEVDVHFVNSLSNAGNKLYSVHEGLFGETEMDFTDQLPLEQVDAIFICFRTGLSDYNCRCFYFNAKTTTNNKPCFYYSYET